MDNLLSDKVVITDMSRFKKVIDLSVAEQVGLPSGHIHREELRKLPSGSSFEMKGKRYYILSCSMQDFILDGLKRNTQIVYPKDAAYILMQMDIAPGNKIGEAGTGSGAMTALFSRAVGKDGRVYTYDQDIGLVNHAIRNLKLDSGDSNVVIQQRVLGDGGIEQNLDAFFLDVRAPWKALGDIYEALKPSGHLGILVPTTNQVSRVLHKLLSFDIWVTEIVEILLRHYKNVPARFRPEDRMVAHTGFLVFGRKLQPGSYRQYQKPAPIYDEDDEASNDFTCQQ